MYPLREEFGARIRRPPPDSLVASDAKRSHLSVDAVRAGHAGCVLWNRPMARWIYEIGDRAWFVQCLRPHISVRRIVFRNGIEISRFERCISRDELLWTAWRGLLHSSRIARMR
jgi:hypothetical protein